jgi:hypothetical protein
MYLIVYLRLTKDGPINITCWDTGCNILFIDCSWLKKILLGNKIRIIAIALTVKSIKSNSYDTSEYIILNLRVPSYNQESIEPIKVILRYEFYIIDKLLANILIGMDIMVPQYAKLDLKGTNLILGADKATLKFEVHDGLIWHVGDHSRLCIPDQLVGEILAIEHTLKSYHNFARTYNRARTSWYINKLPKHVKCFI